MGLDYKPWMRLYCLMDVKDMVENWNDWGNKDPMFAILTDPEKANRGWNEAEFFATGEKHIEQKMKWFRENGIPIEHGKALDFGCGLGRLTNALAKHFSAVHGVDISASMIEGAKKLCRHNEKIEYFQNTQSNLRIFEGGAYDLVYTEIVLQHIPPRYQISYIEDFLRLLSPRGIAFFQTLRARSWRRLVPDWVTEQYRLRKFQGRAFIPMYSLAPRKVQAAIARKGGRLLLYQTFAIADSSASRFCCDIYVAAKTTQVSLQDGGSIPPPP